MTCTRDLMHALSFVAMFTAFNGAAAQPDDSIFGTHAVVFQPIQAGGKEQGCSLVYRAVQADHAYLSGNPVIIVGNISVHRFDAKMLLGLKVGVKDLAVPNSPFTRPHFAYLQTKSKTTAAFKNESSDGDAGFRLYAFGLGQSMDLLLEMLADEKVTIGFNRVAKGLDVLVPLDLTVADAVPVPPDRFNRRRSDEAVSGFTACFRRQLEQGINRAQK